MKLADSNVFLALALSRHVFHAAAHAWLRAEVSAGDLLFCRATQQSMLRLLTTEAVLGPYGNAPLTNEQAWLFYEGLLADERFSFVDEPPDIEFRWKALAARSTSSPKVWMDAYLAPFAISGGYQLVTTDLAFGQFTGLDLRLLTQI